LSSEPAFDDPGTTHKWRVTGANNKSGIFQLQIVAQGMTTIDVTANKLLSTDLADEVEVRIGEQHVSSGGYVFFRGRPEDVVVSPKPGSPIAGYPIALERTATSPLLPTDLSSEPAFDDPGTTHKWRVTGANNKSGIFQLQLTAQGMTTINVTANKLLSTDLADEAVVTVNGKEIPPDGNLFFRGEAQPIGLMLKANSPLAGHELTLTCNIKTGLDSRDVISLPEFNTPQVAHHWDVKGSNNSGTFQLVLFGKNMTVPITLEVSRVLSRELKNEIRNPYQSMDLQAGRDFKRFESILLPHSPLIEMAKKKPGLFKFDAHSFDSFYDVYGAVVTPERGSFVRLTGSNGLAFSIKVTNYPPGAQGWLLRAQFDVMGIGMNPYFIQFRVRN
jgi:hypothetical protein